MPRCLLWFRRDLRLTDHPALHGALAAGKAVVPVYLHAPEEETPWTPGAASRWWLHHSLAALRHDLEQLGSGLVLERGPSAGALLHLAAACGADSVWWNEALEPHLRERDERVRHTLERSGIACHVLPADRLCEPDELRTRDGHPYRVFTPFWKALQSRELSEPLPPPERLPPVPQGLSALHLEQLALRPAIPWDHHFPERWRPGETGAQARLAALAERVVGYAEERDFPARPGTSRLSPHLHFGELSPRQVVAALRHHPADGGAEALLRQLGWREFALHLLHHFPETAECPLDPRYERFPWQSDDAALAAWQQGETGIPLVDAGMRELWQTGWMHNRARMAVASFLTKNLRIHWLEGARWFWDTLVDADLANNTLGWQWTAGCGADAAPYFRVFNPVRQGERFDPEGVYVRRWVPEIAALPDRFVHAPWRAPESKQRQAGVVIGRDYPAPVVDLAASREEALAAWRATVQNARLRAKGS